MKNLPLKNLLFIKHRMVIGGLLIISVAVVLSVLFYMQMQKEKEKICSLEIEIDRVSAERAGILEKIKEVDEEKKRLGEEAEEYSRKAQLLHADISETQQIREDLFRQLSEKGGVIANLNNKLNSVMRQESELNAELKKAKSDYQAIAQKVGDTRSEKIALEEKIKAHISAPGGVELKKIVIKVTPPLEGEIVELNPEYNFAIIDLGLIDDIKSGMLLGIYRKDELIAKAVVENVYEDMSSVIVLDQWSDVPVLTGDIVKLLKS